MKRKITEIKGSLNPFTVPPKIRVCAYVRVSTEHSGQMNSLQNQTEYYERKLKSNPAYEFCGIFSDTGISGLKIDRPGLKAMLEKARAGEIDIIITKSVSRFARNTLMLLKYVRELKDAGVGVIFEEQNINTINAEGELMLTVLAAIAEEERKSVCANVQWAMQNKFKRGEAMVDVNRLMGYDRDENGSLVINKKQAEIVKRIYNLYLNVISGYKIAQILNDEGVPTYTKNPWRSHRILSIISNEKYTGDCLMQKAFVNEEGKQVLNKGQKPKYYVENAHPAIIPRTKWKAAQTIREGRKKKEYPFTGLLKCPYCGASLIRVIHQGGYVSWICATYQQKGKAVCIGMRIADGILEALSKDYAITEPMVLEEVNHDLRRKKRSEKDFRLIPVTQYNGWREE